MRGSTLPYLPKVQAEGADRDRGAGRGVCVVGEEGEVGELRKAV